MFAIVTGVSEYHVAGLVGTATGRTGDAPRITSSFAQTPSPPPTPSLPLSLTPSPPSLPHALYLILSHSLSYLSHALFPSRSLSLSLSVRPSARVPPSSGRGAEGRGFRWAKAQGVKGAEM